MTDPITFGTDGIRGVAGRYPLDPLTVLRIGRAIGRWLGTQQDDPNARLAVMIGHDPRISSYMIASALTAGLLSEGVFVTQLGIQTTPELAYNARGFSWHGLMITASHNPHEQNGIKLFAPDGFKLSDEQERAIETLIASADIDADVTQFNQAATLLSADGYQKHLLQYGQFPFDLSGLKVVLDCANGAASHNAAQIFSAAGAVVIASNNNEDGTTINDHAGSEHVRRDRSALLAAIREHNAELGIAFDGDADRVVFVTPDGLLIDGDHTLGILALQMQAADQLPHNTVVATDMSNSGLEHFLRDHGITLERTAVGDRYVMERMRAGGFALGGEQAGHVIILDDEHTAGDGLYIGLLIAGLAAKNKREHGVTLSELAAQIPRYPQVIASAHLGRRIDLASVAELADLRSSILRAFDGKGRVNVRFSGTEPGLLRAMIEGGPSNDLAEVVRHALSVCKLIAIAADNPNPRIDIVDCVTGAPINL